jgi:hypothetical protein
MRFTLSAQLVAELRAVQAQRGYTDEVIEQEDAFLLDPGLGPAQYLTADGRVLLDFREWNGSPVREATPDEAVSALVIGARKTGVVGLLALLPRCPPDARTCPFCLGTHYVPAPAGADRVEQRQRMCPHCSGRGWIP